MEEIKKTNETDEMNTNSSEYRGNFTVSKWENIRFNLLMIQKNIIISATVLFTVIFGIRLYQQITMNGLPFFSALLQALPLALLAAILIPSLQICSTALSIMLLYRQGKAKTFAQRILLNDEGLFATSAAGTSKLVWKNMAFVRETPFDFLFFYAAKQAFILPKKQMQDRDAETAEVRRLLQSHLPADRMKLRG